MTTYRYTHTRLLVDDLPACVRFYRDVLGFTPVFGDENNVYVEFATGDVMLSLYSRALMGAVTGHEGHHGTQDRLLLSLAVENVDASYEELKSKGVEFVVPPTDRPVWALRTAHFRDPDGNLIEINHGIPMGE